MWCLDLGLEDRCLTDIIGRRFTHISGHPSAVGRTQDRGSSRCQRSVALHSVYLKVSRSSRRGGPAAPQWALTDLRRRMDRWCRRRLRRRPRPVCPLAQRRLTMYGRRYRYRVLDTSVTEQRHLPSTITTPIRYAVIALG